MIARRSGAIVNIASMSGVIVNKPQPQAAYNAAKAGVIHLTKSLAAEWAGYGVRVNAVSPGYVATDMTLGSYHSNAEWARTWHFMTPMDRIGTPMEMAQAIYFLVSDASSFTTGSNLVVDGGYSVW
jgi:NAD(P)-dependent dehydrogenase (short-subunit alcohol dehydrogenase family)